MTLTKPQAEAVYVALCALNNVGGEAHGPQFIELKFADANGVLCGVRASDATRAVWVDSLGGGEDTERHADHDAFATAYGIPDTCSECGGSGEVETGIGMLGCTECPRVTKQQQRGQWPQRTTGMSPTFAAPYGQDADDALIRAQAVIDGTHLTISYRDVLRAYGLDDSFVWTPELLSPYIEQYMAVPSSKQAKA